MQIKTNTVCIDTVESVQNKNKWMSIKVENVENTCICTVGTVPWTQWQWAHIEHIFTWEVAA